MKINVKPQKSKVIEELNTISDIAEQTFYYEQKIHEYQKKVEKNKAYISKKMGKNKRLKFSPDGEVYFAVQKEIKPTVEFYPEKVRAVLDKKVYENVVNKTVKINDLSGLIKLLKSYGVSPKKFKKFISVDEKIDTEKLDTLMTIGDIKFEELHGCYEAEFSENITIRKIK